MLVGAIAFIRAPIHTKPLQVNPRKDANMAQNKCAPPANFDTYPDSALVDVRITAGVLGCSPNTVWRRVKSGGIWPKPINIAHGQTRFRVGDIRKALAALSAA